jgi:hypothetical protein
MKTKILESGSIKELYWGPTSKEPLTFEEAVSWSKEFKEYRLPTIEELLTLVDRKKIKPASLDLNIHSDYYWSSSSVPGSKDHIFLIYFYEGNTFSCHKDIKAYLKLVKK